MSKDDSIPTRPFLIPAELMEDVKRYVKIRSSVADRGEVLRADLKKVQDFHADKANELNKELNLAMHVFHEKMVEAGVVDTDAKYFLDAAYLEVGIAILNIVETTPTSKALH